MEHNGNENLTSPSPTLCTNGCGYYGNSAFDGMCSKCFKDTLKRRQQSASPACLVQSTASQQHDVTPVSQPAVSTVTESTVTTDSTTPATTNALPVGLALATSASAASLISDTESITTNSDGSDTEKSRKHRCRICKKKVGLTGFHCRCGGLFCSTHRYSDKHDCQFDYKQQAQDELRKSNPVVTGEKIRKI